ncbi:hypothetical protein [Sulfurifustis variabilis]|uniref:hypothetical protein n=1 Tax=Sulfurifustis variabilis TaxID=1675686 RepID=UPI000BBACBD3|nr:hypothetical protein [Sulfurifustis variabilis]
MRLSVGIVLACAAVAAGCATQAATSGRVVIRDQNAVVDVSFSRHDRAVIEQYYRGAHQRGLPPGLAKRNGALPPGLAKRDVLPPGLSTVPLPVELERQLTPLPAVYVRVRIGNDIVLMDRKTRVVFDVIYGVVG